MWNAATELFRLGHDGRSSVRWDVFKHSVQRAHRGYLGGAQIAIDAEGCIDAPNVLPAGSALRPAAPLGGKLPADAVVSRVRRDDAE